MAYTKPLLYAGATAIALTAIAWSADRFFAGDGIHQSTNDAYVMADFTTVAPKVAGRIDRVSAEDNEYVHKGEELAHIEDSDFKAALESARGDRAAAEGDIANLHAMLARQNSLITGAESTVQADEAGLTFAQQNATRYHNLSAGGASTLEQQQGAEAHLRQARATLARDRAAVETTQQQIPVLQAQIQRMEGALLKARSAEHQAELNLSYCTIPAPVDGIIGERAVRIGAYVHPGSPLLAVVPTRNAYVLADFQENQLTTMQPGQRATVWVDTFPGHPLHAHIDSLAPATGVAFSPIQPDNATGNFTKVVQRVPVKLVFDPNQPLAEKVRVGMSVEVEVDTSSAPEGPHAHDKRYAWQ